MDLTVRSECAKNLRAHAMQHSSVDAKNNTVVLSQLFQLVTLHTFQRLNHRNVVVFLRIHDTTASVVGFEATERKSPDRSITRILLYRAFCKLIRFLQVHTLEKSQSRKKSQHRTLKRVAAAKKALSL